MKLHASGEDYLETILVLQKKLGMVRSVDIARHMEVSKPSVCHAVATLRDGGFLTMDEDHFLHLTDVGREVAEKIYERHCFFTEQLIAAGVDPRTAEVLSTSRPPFFGCWRFCLSFFREFPRKVSLTAFISVHPSTRESKWRYIMQKINLRELYPDVYKTDVFVDVAEEVVAAIRGQEQDDAAYERRKFRHKAHYSLNREDGIENDALNRPLTPEEVLEQKLLREEVYAALMQLTAIQARRIYARFYLGMTVAEIARIEGADRRRVWESIRRGLKKLAWLLDTAQ